MKVDRVAYRRIFNLGNYESATVELMAELSPGEDPKAAIDALAAEAKNWRKSKDAAPAA